jgi:hypothetical protein
VNPQGNYRLWVITCVSVGSIIVTHVEDSWKGYDKGGGFIFVPICCLILCKSKVAVEKKNKVFKTKTPLTSVKLCKAQVIAVVI